MAKNDIKYTEQIKRGVIIYYDNYPCNGSWPNRINNIMKIFRELNIVHDMIIPYPPTKVKGVLNAKNIIRLQKTSIKNNNLIIDIFYYLKGIIKSYMYLKTQKNVDFVLFAGGNFVICYPILKICRRRGIKVWIDIVDENSKRFEKVKSIRDYLAIFNKQLFYKWLIPKFDKVLVISDFLLEKFIKTVPSEILQKSVPSLIDIGEFDQNAAKNISNKSKELDQLIFDKRLKFLYAGSIVRTNGIFFVMDCFTDLIKRFGYDFLIVIIVLMGDKKRVMKYANTLGIENNLLLLNMQDQSDMPAIYKQSDILFLPEHGNVIANAGFPGKTAELLASGKPIITTKFSDLDKYLVNGVNAMISPIGDSITYKSNLKRLLDDKKLREVIGNNGRKTSEKLFDFVNNKDMFKELISK